MVSLDDKSALLIYRIGPVYCCSPSTRIKNISIPEPLTHPPGTDTAHPGIFKHGNNIVSVSDLRFQFGVNQANWHEPGRMVITKLEEGFIGFWVDEIIDVIQFPKSGWGNLPPQFPRGIFTRTLLLDKHIHLYADFEKLQTLQGGGYLHQYISKLEEEQQKTSEVDTIEKQPAVVKPEDKPESTSNAVSTEKTVAQESNDKIRSANTDSVSKTTQPAPQQESTITSLKDNTVPTAAEKQPGSPSNTEPTHEPASRESTPASTKTVSTMEAAATADSNRAVTQTENHATQEKIEPTINKSVNTDRATTATVNATTNPPIITARKSEDNLSSVPNLNSSPVKTEIKKQPGPETTSESSGFLGLILFFIFIIGGGLAAYYYLMPQTESETDNISYDVYTPPVVEQYTEVVQEPVAADAPLVTETKMTNIPDPDVDIIAETESLPDQKKTVEPLNSTASQQAVTQSSDNNEQYHASIEQDEQGITIILNAPKTVDLDLRVEEEDKNVTSIQVTEQTARVTDTPSTGTESPEVVEKEIPETPVAEPKPKKVEIIHVVVKGDTLWHIAKRYVNNPLLYPELARLSNIKNPHRIYPGNRVRIIRYLD